MPGLGRLLEVGRVPAGNTDHYIPETTTRLDQEPIRTARAPPKRFRAALGVRSAEQMAAVSGPLREPPQHITGGMMG